MCGLSNYQGVMTANLPQEKENRQTAATAWRRAAFRKTRSSHLRSA